MQIQKKLINGKIYRYATKPIRLPNGKVISLQKIWNKESKKEMENILWEKEKKENFKYALKVFGTDQVIGKEILGKIEARRVEYKRLLRKITEKAREDMWDRFTANFTYESNALEGNSLTLKDVSMVMFENVAIKGKDLREIYETRNSRKVVRMIMENKFSINHQNIIKMHRILMKDIDITPGYKKFPNIILGKRIETAPPEKVHQEMTKLIAWYNSYKKSTHPLKLAALFHGRFEQIHPFEDGNGRVGRFLINVILVNNKYSPLIIRNSQRISYLKALENFDTKYSTTLYRLIVKKYRETYKKFFEVYAKYI